MLFTLALAAMVVLNFYLSAMVFFWLVLAAGAFLWVATPKAAQGAAARAAGAFRRGCAAFDGGCVAAVFVPIPPLRPHGEPRRKFTAAESFHAAEYDAARVALYGALGRGNPAVPLLRPQDAHGDGAFLRGPFAIAAPCGLTRSMRCGTSAATRRSPCGSGTC